jgi:2-polyprenyl-3-methyl-5-hydroxy-6-metoxy-1,4-benzoquinol methylase
MEAGNLVETLLKFGLVNDSDVSNVFYPRVRDRDDITVHRSEESGVIFLVHGRSDREVDKYYDEKSGLEYWSTDDYEQALDKCKRDDSRRADQFSDLITGRSWVDVGSGLGGVISPMINVASKICAVEPQSEPRSLIDKHIAYGHSHVSTVASVEDLKDKEYEVVTLFHVFEHLADPVGTLITLRHKMRSGATIIIEVPHARDSLIVDHDCEAFKAATFWSEHLVLHTRESLKMFIEAAGFSEVKIDGYQRYGLANHMRWLGRGRGGGHQIESNLSNMYLDVEYSRHLNDADRTDTLIAYAVNNVD